MPPKGKKATSKTAKRPRDSSDSQSADDTPHNVPHKPGKMGGGRFCKAVPTPGDNQAYLLANGV